MKIAVVPNLTKEAAQTCTDEVLSILGRCGCETVLNLFTAHGIYQERVEDSLRACDVFIAIGGDGTIIHTAKLAASLGKPILGVNAGTLGFTAGVERHQLSLLANLVKGEYREERRLMLSVELSSGGETRGFYAINDAVLSGEPGPLRGACENHRLQHGAGAPLLPLPGRRLYRGHAHRLHGLLRPSAPTPCLTAASSLGRIPTWR